MNRARLAAIVAAPLLMWMALAAWAFASPVGAAPDDDYHLARLYCAAGEANCVGEGAREGACYAMQPQVPASCSDWGQRSLPRTEGISLGQYPPLYYEALAPLTGSTLAETTIAVRIANVTLAVAMFVAAVLLTAPRLRRTVLLSILVASFPLGVYMIASTNPSSWAIISIASIWGPLLTLMTAPGSSGVTWLSDTSRGIIAARIGFIALAATIGLGSRNEVALFLPIVAAVACVFLVPWPVRNLNRIPWKRLLVPLLLVIASLTMILTYGRGRTASLGENPNFDGEPFTGWQVVQRTLNTFLGTLGLPGISGSGLGTYDVPVPALAAALVVVAYTGAILAGAAVMYGRKVVAWGFFGAGSFSLTAVLWSLQNWEYYQPRYFLPLMFVFLMLLLLPRPDRPQPRPGGEVPTPEGLPATRLQYTVILGSLAIANALALLSTLIRFTLGVQPLGSRDPLTPNPPDVDVSMLLSADPPSWWWNSLPLSPSQLWILGSVTAASALMLWLPWLASKSSGKRQEQIGPPPVGSPVHAEEIAVTGT